MAKKSDKQVLKDMFDKRGIEYDEEDKKLSLISGKHKNVGGYLDFASELLFDSQGNLVKVCAWE